MPYRLTKIYTRKGDEGYTTLGDNRLSKDDLLIEALGTIDELNSVMGFVISLQIKNKKIEDCLTQIQHHLFDMGGELHLPERIAITADKVSYLENKLDKWNATLPPLKEFLLPRGNSKSAASHMARTVCRRAERCVVRLHRQIALNNPEILCYLNRLSDLLFVIARILALETAEKEIVWDHERKR
jgi:cob(I)alamin adenosyltransferase